MSSLQLVYKVLKFQTYNLFIFVSLEKPEFCFELHVTAKPLVCFVNRMNVAFILHFFVQK
jgi:hypothetical protein